MELKHAPIVSVDFEEKGFEILKSMIMKKLGLDCSYYRDNYIRRRINFRMKTRGTTGYWDYVRLLRTNAEEYSLLVKDLTINYTKFFRDNDLYEHFQNKILPDVLANKKSLRILSAGCASGEEPYTISMILNEVLGPRIAEYVISIYGIDLDDDCLVKAERAVYEPQEVADVSKLYLTKYFTQNEGKYQVKDNIRRSVHFKHMDLTQPLLYKSLDIIFCRNVFIYFAKTGQTKIFANFYESLQKDGYLIIGKSEMLPEEARNNFRCIDVKCKIFRKN